MVASSFDLGDGLSLKEHLMLPWYSLIEKQCLKPEVSNYPFKRNLCPANFHLAFVEIVHSYV